MLMPTACNQNSNVSAVSGSKNASVIRINQFNNLILLENQSRSVGVSVQVKIEVFIRH
jgi:hypothetical protein